MAERFIKNFYGNRQVVDAIEQMLQQDRLPNTLLLVGPAGVGKATLARRIAGVLLNDPQRVEKDDLSLPENQDLIREREKWPAEKRNDSPLVFGTNPDFLTFPPDGPMRQISIHQVRLLKELAQYAPAQGRWRVFLVDQLDRINEQAANSLLKVLEEPPPYLIIILTAENLYNILPTIRSRSIIFQFSPLSDEEMRQFLQQAGIDEIELRMALARGSPGRALKLDIQHYRSLRDPMLVMVKAACGAIDYSEWVTLSEQSLRQTSDHLEDFLSVLYALLEDLLTLKLGGQRLINIDLATELKRLSADLDLKWLRQAVELTDELVSLVRRNIQRIPALDHWVLQLRQQALLQRPAPSTYS